MEKLIKNKIKICYTVLFVFLFLQIKAQSHIVSDTSTIYPALKSFLLRGIRDTTGFKIGLISEANLIDSANEDFGVFSFRELSSESTPFLYLRNYGEPNISILTKYHIDFIMENLSSYFNKNKQYFTYRQRLACTKRVIEILEKKLLPQ